MRFSESRVASPVSTSPRVLSPYFLALFAIIELICPPIASHGHSPMIYLADSPSSLWKLPEEPICPHWRTTEPSIQMPLSVYRANTLQHKTATTVTRYGMSGVSTPLGNCPGCLYTSDSCRSFGSRVRGAVK